jgi:hypothetical protein
MKIRKLFCFIACLTLFVGQAWADKVRPTKCLFTAGTGKRGSSNAGQQRFEFCSEMNPAISKKIGGVCIFDKGKTGGGIWKRGTWDPSKKGEERFIVKRVCDGGVEYTKIAESALPKGPVRWDLKDVDTDVKMKLHTSKIKPDNYNLDKVVPAVCFFQNDPLTAASADAKSCSTSINANGFCELKNLDEVGPKGFSSWKYRFKGHWWVYYTDAMKRSFRICPGGVTLVDAAETDLVYKKIPNTAPLQAGNAKVCIRKNGAKRIEVSCKADGVGQCYMRPSNEARKAWTQSVFNYIVTKYPDDIAQYSFSSGPSGKKKYEPSYGRLLRWEPDPDVSEDKEFLRVENEKLTKAKRWSQILKTDKDGFTVDETYCDEVIVENPRESIN